MSLKRILVIGPGSLVGSRFVEMLVDEGVEVYGAGGRLDSDSTLNDFQNLDITDYEDVLDVVKNSPADLVINFAGLTVVDEIEKTRPKNINSEEELINNLPYKVNVLGTRYIVKACKQAKKFPILISSDFVFDGKGGPYSEEDAIADNPDDVSFYAWTKILAEKEVIGSGVDFLMIRPSYPYRREYLAKSDFARNLLTLYDDFKAGKIPNLYPIFADQTLTPTFIDDIALALETLLDNQQKGIFHIASPELTTPYDFFCELLKVARGVKGPEDIIPRGSIVEFQKNNLDKAKRPINGGLKTDKIQRLGFSPTSWIDGIKKAYTR